MKSRILNTFICLFLAAFVATSCLDDEEFDYEYSSNASITAFFINNIETPYQTVVNGKDTTLIETVIGSNYPFIIDQNQGLIYNVDSLPVGTKINKVVPEITADGYVFIVAEKDSIWEEGDSLNFENPILFKVMAMNGSYGRIYTAQINVHKQEPEKMNWSVLNSNFNKEIERQKAVYFNQQILVFAEQEKQVSVTITHQNDGKQWTSLEPIDIPVKADYSSVIAWNGNLYILAENELYNSIDGIHWQKTTSEQKFSTLLACVDLNTNKKLIGITSDNFYTESTDGLSWTTYANIPSKFPQSTYSFAAYPLKTNNRMSRIVIMGQNNTPNDSTNIVWSQLSSEHEWTELSMEGNRNNCPNLNNSSMIYYNNQLYAFGGPGKNGSSSKAFEYFYTSNDHGIGWTKTTNNVMFPSEFKTLYDESKGNYSFVVDENHFLWIMWSKSDRVWKGRINKLGFIN